MMQIKPTLKWLLFYGLAYLGAFMALLSPITVTLALRIGDLQPTNKTAILSVILGTGAFAALISNPIFGRLSDRSTLKLGRRRGFIIIGTILATSLLLILPLFTTIWVIAVVWILVQITYNIALSALSAVIADQVAEDFRGTAAAAQGLGGTLGVLIGVSLASAFNQQPILSFGVPAVVGGVLVLLFGFSMSDTPSTTQVKKEAIVHQVLASFSFNPFKSLDYTKSLLARFMLLVGTGLVTSYQVYFMQDQLGWSRSKTAAMIVIITIVGGALGVLGNVLSGVLSDKYGRRKIFLLVSAILFSLATLVLAFFNSFAVLIVVVVMLGWAQGVIGTLAYAITTLVLPDQQQTGKWLGIANISATLPQSVAPAIAPLFLAIAGPNNYTALFIAAAVIELIGGWLVYQIKTVK
ncbi:MAG: MFS transporter [Lactobacillaceae bacterium]|jgi:MFS family permease|nr:MFS transporter [Lactobacillaceae bacterium]